MGSAIVSKDVLMCDDEVHILRAAEFKVARAGYSVRMANDGQEAWEMIEQSLPDLLVTDLQMPRVDGLELVRRIRENELTRSLPILMLTAKGFELDREEMMHRWGVLDVLTKPFSPRELVHLIDEVLGVAPVAAT